MRKTSAQWNVYRTRFLIKARQLTEPLSFMDILGREHRGNVGDYLVESSDGTLRIAPREIFEDVYVALESKTKSWSVERTTPKPDLSGYAALIPQPSAFRTVEKPRSHS